jgi:hypothetical protein
MVTFVCELSMAERWRAQDGGIAGEGCSVRRRTQRAGLSPEIDVQPHHEKLTRTHAVIVGHEIDKVNRINRKSCRRVCRSRRGVEAGGAVRRFRP